MRRYIDILESFLAESLPNPDNLADLDSIVSYTFSDIDWGGGSGEGIMQEYAEDFELSDDELNDIDISSPQFKEWFSNWVEERVWDAWGNFSHLFDEQGNAILYRVITADPTWKPGDRHPGIYWSWDQDAAEAHWGSFGNGHVKFRMTARINSSVVDWTTTLAQNIQPDYEDEKEIRIKENAAVEILKTEIIR